MSQYPRRRIVPISLGLAMLAVIAAAALVPNAGAVPAATNCSYGQCPSSSGLSPWELASIGAVIVLGLLVGLFVLMRRRRRPPAEGMSGGPAGPASPPSGVMPPTAPAPPPPGGAGADSYVETPDDVGAPPPEMAPPPAPVTPAAAAAAAPAAGESEPDIDSLMAELDKISSEILKRTPKKGTTQTSDQESDAGDDSGN